MHTVRRGENLSKIAKRYGVTVQQIKKANNFAGDNIQTGQKIKIPVK
ncbi:MAG: LysM peptidoglycan-binding domain-containing protein [Muribaculaceae bacterium]|nr:LysM peptidoglycan-binding domain-containing protein [Muribaculaceae bacterium]